MDKEIDINTWNRRKLYEHFSRMKQPHYVVAANIDVTKLLVYKRRKQLSYYLSLIYLATKCLNGIDNFRLRIVNGRVTSYDKIHANFTHKRADEDLFRYYTAPFEGSIEDFVEKTTLGISRQTTLFGGLEACPNVAYFSCAPTLDATCISNPGMEDPDDAIPRINWGRYVDHDGQWLQNISFTANHRFIDGYHIGLFFASLQASINDLPIHM